MYLNFCTEQVGCIPCTANTIGKLKKHIVDLIWLEY